MSEFKFSCPLCGQHMQCDEAMGGQQIRCPVCHGDFVIPQTNPQPRPAVRVNVQPAPPPSAPPAAPVPPPAYAPPPPPPPSAPPRRPTLEEDSRPSGRGGVGRIVRIAVVVAVLSVAVYFGYPLVRSWQSSINTTREKAAKEGGGELGHIAELYSVLDATDPDKMASSRYDDGPARAQRGQAFPGKPWKAERSTNAPAVADLPIIPPSWTLEVDTAKIPAGRANGSISGTNFVVDAAYLSINGPLHVLTLRQGTNFYAEREILVYLRLKPGEKIAGHTWTVNKDPRAGAPQVVKRWKPNPRFAAQQKSFPNGYALKLEFGQVDEEEAPGKIYLALPDAEQTVVAGAFEASIHMAVASSGTIPQRRSRDVGYGDE